MRSTSVGLCVVLGIGVVGCGDGGDDKRNEDAKADDAGSQGDGDSVHGDAAMQGDGDSVHSDASLTDNDADTGGDDPADAGPGSGEVAACAATEREFTDPSGTEFMQWWWGDSTFAATSQPAKASDYLKTGTLVVGILHLGSAEIVTIKMGDNLAPIGSTIPAGTYTCADNQVGINSSFHGFSQQDVEDSGCAVTFTKDVAQGGRVEGTFWAYLPPQANLNLPGGCVTGRFGLTDTP